MRLMWKKCAAGTAGIAFLAWSAGTAIAFAEPTGGDGFTVAPGDTLSALAARYGTTVSDLARANGIANPDVISAGVRLALPGRVVVVPGENLTVIAARFGTTVSALAAANGIENADLIVAGTRLVIPAARSTTTAGIDISYPQCGDRLPSGRAFAVVGVNDGRAGGYNSCLGNEFSYAATLTGTAELYVNTADPGSTVVNWPYNSDGLGSYASTSTPYGECVDSNTDTAPCAYVYGYNMVRGTGSLMGDVRYFESVTGRTAADHRWWLDVETVNSWVSDTTMNVAALQGMVKGLRDAGVTSIGVYSTAYQWGQITGTPGPSFGYSGVTVTNTLWGLPDWIPGARTESGAISNCSLAAFTNSAHPLMTQWFGHPYDGDHFCS